MPLEVATGGDPIGAYIAAVELLHDGSPFHCEHVRKRGPLICVNVRHDDGCPCLRHPGLASCTCELIVVEAVGEWL